MARKSKKSEWEKSLNLMSLDELYYILSTPDAYETGYVQMAKEKLDDLADLTEHEAMKVIVQRCLEDMGCKCEIDEEGYINFWFQAEMLLLKEREQVALAHSVMDVSPDDMPVC